MILPGHAQKLPPGTWQLLSSDPVLGEHTYFDYHEPTDETRLFTVYDGTEATLDFNKALQNEGRSFYARDKDFWHAALVPPLVIHEWYKEGINFYDENDWPKVRQKLNSPEYRWLRTGEFRI